MVIRGDDHRHRRFGVQSYAAQRLIHLVFHYFHERYNVGLLQMVVNSVNTSETIALEFSVNVLALERASR